MQGIFAPMANERDSTMNVRLWIRCIRALAVAAVIAVSWIISVAGAQVPEIVIGQSAGYTGRTTSSVKEFMEGAQAYFDAVNKRGGVAGRKIFLNTLDDGYLPELVADNTRRLIDEDKAVALFGYFGDAPVNAALPIIKEKRIALVGAVTGAEAHRSNPNLFFVRASYQMEAEKIVAQGTAQGLNKFAIFFQNDEFGKDVLAGLQKALDSRKLPLAGQGTYERNSLKVDDAVGKIAATMPQSIVMACTLEACAEFVRQIKKRGLTPRFNHLSSIDIASLHKELGELSRGLEVSRVVPPPQSQSVPVVNEYAKALKDFAPKAQPSSLSLEGYLAAKALVEGLKRAGANPNRQSLLTALEGMRSVDLGGFVVNFAGPNRRGSDFADVTIIGPGGRVKY